MAKIADVAAYILREAGPMTAMKLQKLCYYAQAWSLVWDGEALFNNRIEAWANGPVVVDLYQVHKGRFTLADGDIEGNPDALNIDEAATVDGVLMFYNDFTAHQLSELTHSEAPWRGARRLAGLQPMQRGSVEISHAAMAEYYDSLTVADES